jgi:Ca2+-binding RTX toxin-like protein
MANANTSVVLSTDDINFSIYYVAQNLSTNPGDLLQLFSAPDGRRYLVDWQGAFTYDASGHVTSGTLSGITVSVFDSNQLLYTFTGANSDFLALTAQAISNPLGATASFLSGNDVLNGGAAADILRSGLGNDSVYGGAGNDEIEGGGGDDLLDGGLGTDLVSYASAASAVTVNLSIVGPQNTVGAGIDTISGFENLRGSAFNDTLTGDAADNMITGGAGNDVLDGAGGIDTVSYADAGAAVTVNLNISSAQNTGGGGSDTLSNFERVEGSRFDDVLIAKFTGSGLIGGDGNDALVSLAGSDFLAGGNGFDTAYYGAVSSAVTVDLNIIGSQNTGGGGTDTLASIEGITGSNFSDILIGNAGRNNFNGSAGNDFIDGGAGDDFVDYSQQTAAVTVDLSIAGPQTVVAASAKQDTLVNIEWVSGGSADDVLTGNSFDNILAGRQGNDILDGGAGRDLAAYTLSASAVFVNLSLVGAQNTGGAGFDTLINIEGILGSAFNDTLTGDAGDNLLSGFGGDDILSGGAGNDTAYYGTDAATSGVTVSLAIAGPQATGGAGTDTLIGIESLTGSIFSDVLTGDSGANLLTGWGAGDTLYGGDGDDSLKGDFLPIYGGSNGPEGDDKLYGGVGNDDLQGDGGQDLLDGGAGNDSLDGGAGEDTASYASATAAVKVSLAILTAQNTLGAGTDTLINIENLTGSAFGDTLTGDTGNNLLRGGLGDDKLTGGGGIDTASYDDASGGVTVSLATTLAQNTGSAGIDTLKTIENLQGSNFNDVLTGNNSANVILGGLGNDVMDGGAGSDTVSYINIQGVGVNVDLSITTRQDTRAGIDILVNFENITGSNLHDVLTGNSLDNVIIGGRGTDQLSGGDGNDILDGGEDGDTLFGGNGNDTLIGGAPGVGANLLSGGEGNDVYIIADARDQLIELAGQGTDSVQTSLDFSLLAFTEIENLTLTGTDTVSAIGNGLANTLTGNNSANSFDGDAGNDKLLGLGGNDTLQGGAGADTLTGGLGADTLWGGSADKDSFVYLSVADSGVLPGSFDSIMDFDAKDVISLKAIDADAVLAGDQAFSFIGTAAFSALGQVRYAVVGGNTVVEINVTGDLAADMQIVLSGYLAPLVGADFIL